MDFYKICAKGVVIFVKNKSFLGKLIVVFLVFLLSVGISACAPAPDKEETTSLRTPEDTLVFFAAESLTGQWDPTMHTNLAQIRVEQMYFDYLFHAWAWEDDSERLEPSLALEATVIDDRTIEYKLREDVSFHDGTPFTAEDVKATFEYASQPIKPTFGWFPAEVKGEVIDDYTVRLSTEEPAASLWFSAAFIPIMSAKDIEAGTVGARINGTGPYMFDSIDGEKIIFVRNEDYFRGIPKTKYFIYEFVSDASTRLLALLAGEADVVDRLEPEQVATVEGSPVAYVDSVVSPSNKFLHFRNKYPFDNVLLRRAVAHAIDRDAVAEILGVAGIKAQAHISPVKFGYAPVGSPYEYDPAKARELMAEAGYPDGQGLPELEYITSIGFYAKTKEYGEFITAQLNAVGFPVKLTVLETAAWGDRLYSQDAGDMMDSGWMTGNPEPDLVLRMIFHSSTGRISFASSPRIDEALDRSRGEWDFEKRRGIYQKEVLPLLWEELFSIPLVTEVVLHGIRKEVKGFEVFPSTFIDPIKFYKEY